MIFLSSKCCSAFHTRGSQEDIVQCSIFPGLGSFIWFRVSRALFLSLLHMLALGGTCLRFARISRSSLRRLCDLTDFRSTSHCWAELCFAASPDGRKTSCR